MTNLLIDQIKSERIPKGWGWEEVLINRSEFCGKILYYNKANSVSSYHFHRIKREYFRCVAGSFILRQKDQFGIDHETILKVGDSVYISNNIPHQLISLENNSEIYEISTTHYDFDVVRISPGDSQIQKT